MNRPDRSKLWGIAAVAGIAVLGTGIGYLTLREDPQTRSDMEGRNLLSVCLHEA